MEKEKYKSISLLLCILFVSNTSCNTYCGGRIVDVNNQLNSYDMNSLCTRLGADNRFLFNVQRYLTVPSANNNDIYFDNEANKIFLDRCQGFGICISGFLVSVFTDARKVRITAGSGVSQVATISDRQRAIEAMSPFLKVNDFYNAFLTAFDTLRVFKPKTSTITTTTQTTTKTTTVHHSSGVGFAAFVFFILIPVCIICCCLYWMYQRQQEETQVVKTNINSDPQAIYNHITRLENLINQARSVSPMIRVEYCLICFNGFYFNAPPQGGPQSFEMQNLNSNQGYNNNYHQERLLADTDSQNTRFECGHIWHTSCLGARNVNFCLLCKSSEYSTPSMKIPNTSNFQVVTELQINTMIQNLKFLYSKDQMVAYTTTYPDHYRNHSTVIIIDDYHYYHPMHHDVYYHHGYDHGYGGGYDNTTYQQSTTVQQTTVVEDSGVVNSAGGDYGGGSGCYGGTSGGGNGCSGGGGGGCSGGGDY